MICHVISRELVEAAITMTQPKDYQFVIDGIPNQFLDEFILVMLDFQNRTSCQFLYRYKEQDVTTLHPVKDNLEFIKSGTMNFN